MNLLFVSFALLLALILIALVIFCRFFCLHRCWQPIVKFVTMIERKLMFNSVLRAMMVAYLALAIQVFYSWKQLKIEPGLETNTNFLLLLCLTLFAVGFPYWTHRFTFNNFNRVRNDDEFDQRYGTLFVSVKKDKYEGLIFSSVFLARRLLFAYTICYLSHTITLQVMVIDVLSTGYLCYMLLSRPMTECLNNML